MLKIMLGLTLVGIPLIFLLSIIVGTAGYIGLLILAIAILFTLMIATGIALLVGEL